MKIINFLRALPQYTLQCLIGYFHGFKYLWTNQSVFYSLDQTYFSGDNASELRQARDKFIQDYRDLIKQQ